jgi:ankyrin repeat protein
MQGCNLEAADYDKRTALHLAASEGHPDLITFLLNVARVRADPKDRWQRTPLMDAQAENHYKCVELLKKAMTLNEHSEDEDQDSGVNIPLNLYKSPSHTKGLTSQANSVPSSDSSDEDELDQALSPNSHVDDTRNQTSPSPPSFRARTYSAQINGDIHKQEL